MRSLGHMQIMRKKTVKKTVKKKVKRSRLVKNLDAAFSRFIRARGTDKKGLVTCYTCPKVGTIQTMQCGHYVTRSIYVLRWDPDNCRPQCYGCNVMHGGRVITFRENLVNEIGEEAVLALEAKRHQLFKPKDEWLIEQLALYEA